MLSRTYFNPAYPFDPSLLAHEVGRCDRFVSRPVDIRSDERKMRERSITFFVAILFSITMFALATYTLTKADILPTFYETVYPATNRAIGVILGLVAIYSLACTIILGLKQQREIERKIERVVEKPLWYAVKEGDLETFKSLIAEGEKLDDKSLLIYAAFKGNREIVQLLFEWGIQALQDTESMFFIEDYNILVSGVLGGNLETVTYLVEEQTEAVAGDLDEALWFAAMTGKREIVEFLILHGADGAKCFAGEAYSGGDFSCLFADDDILRMLFATSFDLFNAAHRYEISPRFRLNELEVKIHAIAMIDSARELQIDILDKKMGAALQDIQAELYAILSFAMKEGGHEINGFLSLYGTLPPEIRLLICSHKAREVAMELIKTSGRPSFLNWVWQAARGRDLLSFIQLFDEETQRGVKRFIHQADFPNPPNDAIKYYALNCRATKRMLLPCRTINNTCSSLAAS